jgi:hypothetical protein
MSLISGSYSRLLWTGGAALWSADMVENAFAEVVRKAKGVDWAVRRAIGLAALLKTLDRWRRFREAVLHRLRLKDDMLN